MSVQIVARDEDGRLEGYCGICRRWRLLGRHTAIIFRRISSHDQRYERAAAVAEAVRITQEGARA